jgi:hypothetical protein
MEHNELPTHEFFSRVWIHYVQAFIFGGLAAFGLILGPLFYCGVIRPADGRPGTDAAIPLCVVGAILLIPFSLAVFGILSNRRPMLGIYREGLTFHIARRSALDEIPLVPGLIRVAWSFVSLSGFRTQWYIMPWEFFDSVMVTGLPMVRRMSVSGHAFPCGGGSLVGEMTFAQVAFTTPLDQIAGTIQAFASEPGVHEYLPSWKYLKLV